MMTDKELLLQILKSLTSKTTLPDICLDSFNNLKTDTNSLRLIRALKEAYVQGCKDTINEVAKAGL